MANGFYVVQPQDSLFFRDGRPYEQADDGLAAAASLFPPHPTTLTGALRVALAMGNGWEGSEGWPKDILGDGQDLSKGTVRFGALLLMRQVGEKWQPLYPAPRNLLVRKASNGLAFATLSPHRTPALTDLGLLHPMLPPKGWENAKDARPAHDWWLTADGLAKVLAGEQLGDDFAKTHVVHSSQLWEKEPRIGLEMSAESRTAVRGRLYAPTHVRLRDNVGLGIAVSDLPDRWKKPASIVPLGGEHRFAHLEPAGEAPKVPELGKINHDSEGNQLVSITLLSPARVDTEWLKPGPLFDGKAEILSACLGDVLPIGGWDSRPGPNRGPVPLRAFLPAGSCWFLRMPPDVREKLPSFLGDAADNAHGFGHYALGTFQFSGE
ncbi:type III-B CRISPR module-associated Cmr3 family protein [Niveispirillum irakense]|uniref:type III-B CRISPR module-associated Cmr3 family protein n=1 Tax=Niveispirillum irakense TaxID=34011 RepID=UPI00054F4B59|nr:type III-B CRISPR module-associated Cmr3 family protein [Niveispirillum irakense]